MSERADVVVVGDGPAGAALAQGCVAHGLDARLVGSGASWVNTYGTWATAQLGDHRDAFRWTGAISAFGTRHHRLELPYGIFDNAVLRARLVDGVSVVPGHVAAIRHRERGTSVRLGDGTEIDASVVVDASGQPPALLGLSLAGRQPSALRAWRDRRAPAVPMQTAFGVVLSERPSIDGIDADRAVLMDWRQPSTSRADTATFLYVVPVADGWLVEETCLAGAPLSMDDLRDRLASRLGVPSAALDAGQPGVRSVEHVRIPLPGGVPDRTDVTVGFGAAARAVHPATGYSIGDTLRTAPRVAEAIAAAVHTRLDTRQAAEVIWRAVWPPSAVATRRLHDFGLRRLLELGSDVDVFFDAFFDQPASVWHPYLCTDSSPAAVAAAMRGVFAAVPWRVRRTLIGAPGSR